MCIAQVIDQVMQEEESDEDEDELLAMLMENEQAASKETEQVAPGTQSIHDKCKDELSKYINAATMAMKQGKKNKDNWNNPLEWWKSHEESFPTLSILAKKFLAIQGSSAPSERIFSQASLLISAKRTSMDPHIAGKALFVKQNWERFEKKIDFLKVVGKKEDVQKFLQQVESIADEDE
jgi:hypothetical protein